MLRGLPLLFVERAIQLERGEMSSFVHILATSDCSALRSTLALSMSMLALIKTFITALEGTPYEPWVDGVLFVGFLVAIFSATSRLFFHRESIAAAKAALALLRKAHEGLDNSIQYAPDAEEVRKKAYPYVELVSSLFFALVALLYGGMVGLLTAWLHSKLIWHQALSGWLFFAACMLFMRYSLASATWAWHSIKTGQELTRRSTRMRRKRRAG